MDSRARLALAVGGGYLLGRTRKLKFALTMASVVARRQLASSDTLLSRGMEMVRSSPEFSRLLERLGGVGKSAATAAVGGAMRRATDRIEQPSRSGDRDEDDRDSHTARDEDEDYEAQEDEEDEQDRDEDDQEDRDEDEDEGEQDRGRRGSGDDTGHARESVRRREGTAGRSTGRRRSSGSNADSSKRASGGSSSGRSSKPKSDGSTTSDGGSA